MKISVRVLSLSLIGFISNIFAQQATILWTYDTPSLIRSSPAVGQDGTIYLCAGATLCAITNYGSNKWTFAMGGSNAGSPVVGSDGSIFVENGGLGQLLAVKSNGSLKWRFTTAGGNVCPGLACDNTTYVNGYHVFYAASTAGATNWSLADGGDSLFASPVVGSDGSVYFAPRDLPALRALNPLGTDKWSTGLADSPGDSPALSFNNVIYIGAGPLYAFLPNGTNLWVSQTNDFRFASPVIGKDGTIYASTSHGSLCAFTPSGGFKWQALTNGFTPGTTPAIDSAGNIHCVAYSVYYSITSAGAITSSVSLLRDPWDMYGTSVTSPTIGPDGTVYVTSANRLYAIYNTNKLADSPWPMYRQNARHTGKVERSSLQQPKKRADANFEFQLYAQMDQTQTVQTSTDLVSWSPLTNVVVTNVPLDVVDLSASNYPMRFYRTLSR